MSSVITRTSWPSSQDAWRHWGLARLAQRLTPAARPERTGLGLLDWTARARRIAELPFRLDAYPYLRELYLDPAPQTVIMKAGQVGVTEYGINRALWTTCELGGNVLYVLPVLSPDASDFSQARLRTAIQDSPAILELAGEIDNVGLKRVGLGLIYCRGSERRHALKELAADLVVIEELDECNAANLPFAYRRLDHSTLKHRVQISNPTLPGVGIHALWEASDQREWHVPCPRCGRRQPLRFERNLIPGQDGAPASWGCEKCQTPLDRTAGAWVPAFPDRDVRGYHISQALSPRVTAQELLDDWRAAEGDTFKEQAHFTLRRGEPYAAKGQKIDLARLMDLRGAYDVPKTALRCSMGVDVGAVLHVRISQRVEGDVKRALWAGTVAEFTELDALMRQFDVACCVVDALPETREARAFQKRHRGRVWLAYYHDNPKTETAVWKLEEGLVQIHRTQACDALMDRVRTGRLQLPRQADALEPRNPHSGLSEWFTHLHAPVRIRRQDARGNEVNVWVTPGEKPDHFFHAELYDDVAQVFLNTAPPPRAVPIGWSRT